MSPDAPEANAPLDKRLGEPTEVFQPSPANTVAGYIIAALLLAAAWAAIWFPLRAARLAGWNLPFNREKGWCWFAVLMLVAIGVGLAIGAVALLLKLRVISARRVELCPGGLRFWSGSIAEEVPWAEVRAIRETTVYQRPPVLKGEAQLLLPKLASKGYTVVAASGKVFACDGNSIKEHV